MLLLFAVALSACRQALLAGESTPCTRATHFLTNDFRPHVFLWEVLELIRRTVLTVTAAGTRTPAALRGDWGPRFALAAD